MQIVYVFRICLNTFLDEYVLQCLICMNNHVSLARYTTTYTFSLASEIFTEHYPDTEGPASSVVACWATNACDWVNVVYIGQLSQSSFASLLFWLPCAKLT